MLITPNLSLQYIDLNEAQREVVHNAAVRALDALVHLAVLDRDLATPPVSPSDGQRYLVAASPTGAWTGHAKHIAAWQDGVWTFYVPQAGWLAYVGDEGTLLAWNGSDWVNVLSLITSLQNLSLLGIGTTADATNPFSAKLNNTLWVARTVAEGGDGDLRYKLSKETAGNTLSLLFQDSFSGRAEIGLTGDDNFHFKVSPDGASWFDALTLSRASGAVTITAAHASALAVGRQGATAPALCIDSSAASAATGIKIAAAAAAGGVTLAAISSGTNESLAIDAKGSGTITLAGTSTGAVLFGRNANPASNDGAALGTAALMWSDAFFAAGAVLNFNNGNVTLAHSSGALTCSGAFGIDNGLSVSGGGAAIIGNTVVTGSLSARAASAGVNTITIANSRANDYVLMNMMCSPQAADGYTLFEFRCYTSLVSLTTSAGFGFVKEGSGTDAKAYVLFNTHDGTSYGERWRTHSSGCLMVGSPTGGDKGAGTINAKAVHDDGTVLTCFGIEYLVDGRIDLDKWDRYSPTGRNDLVHRFAEIVETFDPRDPRQYLSRMRAERALPGMPTESEWRHNALSLGALHNRLWLSAELLGCAFAGHVAETDRRLAALEARA